MKFINGILLNAALFSCSVAYADQATNLENGRLKICQNMNVQNPGKTIEIPTGGNFIIPSDKLGTKNPVTITQTNFPTGAGENSEVKFKTPDGYAVKFEQKNSANFAEIDFKDYPCIYLNAQAPLPDTKDMTFSGSFVSPAWNKTVASRNTQTISYRYFDSLDPTYYIASDVGKNIEFVVHDMQTGSRLNHDSKDIASIANTPIAQGAENKFRSELENLNQLDVNVLKFSQLDLDVKANDVKDAEKLNAIISKFKMNVKPQPNSRLVLLLPLSEPVKLEFSNTAVYGSKVEGLGFYADKRVEVNSVSLGVLCVFFNFQTVIIDVDSGKVMAVKNYVAGHVIPASRTSDGNIFNALNDNEKFNTIGRMISEGVSKVVTEIFVSK